MKTRRFVSRPHSKGMAAYNPQHHEAVIGAASDIGPEESFPIKCLGAMKGLWGDHAVQECIKRGNEYALHDNIQ